MPRGPSKGRKGGKGRKGRDYEDDYGYPRKDQQLVKPPDQEKLTDSQLREELIKSLTSTDPTKPKNRVVWDYNEKAFVPMVNEEQTVHMFHLDSELIFKDSTDELRAYQYDLTDDLEDPETKDDKPKDVISSKMLPSISSIKKDVPEPSKEETKSPEEGEETEEKEEVAPPKDDKPKKLLNQFNFCERASQSQNNPTREHHAQTQPPPRSGYKDYCNAWVIYDAYEADSDNRPKHNQKSGAGAGEFGTDEHDEEAGGAPSTPPESKERKTPPKETTTRKDRDKEGKVAERERVRMRKPSILEGQAAQEAALAKSAEGLKILERLVMQNVHNEVLHDFKYYEDASDEFRETGEGTLLPLWKFTYDRAKKHHVTSVSWSKSEPDVFAVSYGSFNFMHPILDGMVLVWSLRNSAFPEHSWLAPKGAMCCAIHPAQDCLIAVGLYDGNVALLQLREDEDNSSRSVILKNCHTIMKHRSPIWSVRWAENETDDWPNFYSCGMDGRVIHWVIDPSAASGGGGLSGTAIATLHLPVPPVQGPDGTNYKLFGCARCMAFHPKEKTTFLVGTAEGNIFRCSMLYGSRFQQIYNAHFLPVAALEWNYYHADVFISCSEDWTIKIWDRNDIEPMYVFEIGVAILDCAWAPYSATVFSAVTEEGKVLVYDLNVNKERPICCQQVVTKKKVRPNRVEFNPFYPLLIVGDDRGQLTSLKLSPNLRILPRDTRNILLEGDVRINFEINKMTKLLSLVRDPESVTNIKALPPSEEKQAKNVLAAMGPAKSVMGPTKSTIGPTKSTVKK